MADISSEFIVFLEKNYPDEYRRATVDGVEDEVINSVISRRMGNFKIWQKIPQWIKNEYGDRIPKEVLNGSKSIRTFIKEEKEENIRKEQETAKVLDMGVGLLAFGYSVEVASEMAKNKTFRDEMLAMMESGQEMTEEQREQWRETRRADRRLVLKEWKEHQPEKYLLHLAKAYSRTQGRFNLATTEHDKAKFEMRMNSVKQEMAEFMERFQTKEDKEKLVQFLQGRIPQQVMRNLSGDALQLFTSVLEQNGIKIESATTSKTLTREKVVDDFKKDHSRVSKFVNVIKERYGANMDFSIGAKDVVGMEKGSLCNMINDRIVQRMQATKA